MKVKDCMCGEICFVKPETTIKDIAKIMEQNHIGCVPVCNNQNALVGLITDRDIVLRGIACNKDVNTTKASDIMTTNVCTCNQEDDIDEAQNKMSKNQIRRIPVVDNNKIIGILTLGDLANYNYEIGEEIVCDTLGDICECGGQAKNNC